MGLYVTQTKNFEKIEFDSKEVYRVYEEEDYNCKIFAKKTYFGSEVYLKLQEKIAESKDVYSYDTLAKFGMYVDGDFSEALYFKKNVNTLREE